jgi:hypothetical protein
MGKPWAFQDFGALRFSENRHMQMMSVLGLRSEVGIIIFRNVGHDMLSRPQKTKIFSNAILRT